MKDMDIQKVEMKQVRKRGRYGPFLPRAVLGLCIIHPLLPIKTLPRLSFRFNTPCILVLESMLAHTAAKEELLVMPRCRGSLPVSVHAPSFLTHWKPWPL